MHQQVSEDRKRCIECTLQLRIFFYFAYPRCITVDYSGLPALRPSGLPESAALLVDEVLSHEPMRQWVLNFPFQLRFLFASRPQIMARVLGIVYRVIATHLIACIEDPVVIKKILTHLKEKTTAAVDMLPEVRAHNRKTCSLDPIKTFLLFGFLLFWCKRQGFSWAWVQELTGIR